MFVCGAWGIKRVNENQRQRLDEQVASLAAMASKIPAYSYISQMPHCIDRRQSQQRQPTCLLFAMPCGLRQAQAGATGR